MRNFLAAATGISGALAVTTGALGAHMFSSNAAEFKEIWKTGCHYHLIHTCALGLAAFTTSGRKQRISGWLFLSGIILFSGSCYTVAYMNEKKPYSAAAPWGGMCFIVGWLALGFM
ncbi:unnamed protein product [Ectocarpus fasciculatus]